MRTTRRFFLALVTVGIGIAVPMTLKASAAVLTMMWSLIGVALLGALLTWEPVARRVPYRVVNVTSPRIAADAALATECAALAKDMHTWIADHDMLPRTDGGYSGRKALPPKFGELFDGRLFDTLDKLAARGCLTLEQVRERAEHRNVMPASTMLENVHLLDGWARRLRRR